MKRVLVRGIPHWEEGDVRLPVIAGGDHIPGHVGTVASGEGGNTAIGLDLFNTDGTPAGKLIQATSGSSAGTLFLIAPDGSPTKFTGGTFLADAGAGKLFNLALDTSGNIVKSTTSTLDTGDGTDPAFRSTIAGAQFDADQARIQREWQSAEAQRQEAAARGDQAAQNQWQERQNQLQQEWAVQNQDRSFEQARLQWDWQTAENKRQEAVARGDREEERRWAERQDVLQRQFVTGEREAGQVFSAEQNRLAQEATSKRQRLGVLSDLIQGFVSSQAQARDTLANLQPDPFRFAAVSGGVAPFGVTPQQGFQEQLQQFAGAPVPQIGAEASLPTIESAIQGLTGAQVPLSPQVFGAAGGAMIPAPPPGGSVAVKVGERGEEVLRITAQGVEVIPLSGGMQAGGTIGFPFEPIPFDKSTLLPALGTSGIFGSLGFSRIPEVTRSPAGVAAFPGFQNTLPGATTSKDFLDRLGIAPRLVRGADFGKIFSVDDSGNLRLVPRSMGINPSDVVQVDRLQDFGTGRGPDLTRFPRAPTEQVSPFTKFSTPIIEPTTGTFLPAPFMIASQLNKLRLTDPFVFNMLLSAYEAAGVPGTDVLATVQAALPFGQARGNIGLR